MMERPKTPTIDADDVLRLDKQVCFALYAASNVITGLYRPVLAELGLTFSQYLVMLVLWGESPQSVGSLGQQLYLDSGTLTPLLKRMESAGLITRRRDSQDERRVLITLTAQGDALRTPTRQAIEKLAACSTVSEEEADTLRNAARNMITALTRVHASSNGDKI